MIRPPKLLELNAFSITVFYLVFALLWILLSDQLLIWFTNDPLLISRYQTLKGILYVLVTAVFLFFLITKSNEKISARKERIDNALYAAGMATWSVDLKTKNIRRSKFHHKVLGLPKKFRKWDLVKFYRVIHPEDRALVREKFEKTIQKDLPYYQVRYRVLSSDKNVKWMQSRGNLIYDSNNKPIQLAGVIADITEQKKLEEDYTREQELFESIFDNIPVLINLHNESGHVYRVNKFFEEKVGFTNAELDSIDLIKEMIPDEEILKSVLGHMNKADGNWKDFDIRMKSGSIIHTTWTNIKVSDNLSVGIGIDTTELKQKERELEELTIRYKQAEKLAGIGNWSRNLITGEIKVSDGFYNILEVNPKEKVLDFNLLEEIIHPEDWPDFIKEVEDAMDSGILDTNYRVIKQKSGEIAHIHELGQVEFDDEESPIMISGTVQDVTEAKTSQAEIRESRELLQKTFESLKESVIILDPGTRLITDCNSTTHELFGYSGEELIGSSTKMLHISEEHFNKFGEMGAEDLQQKGFFRTEFEMKRKDGTRFYSDHTVTLVKNKNGETEKVVSVVRDVTEQKKYEKELKRLANRYRRAEKIAKFGHWQRNVKTDEAIWSEGFYNIIGLEPGEHDTSYESMLEMVHPDDREDFDAAFKNALETGTLNVRYRLIKPSTGEVGYYHELAQTTYDEAGNPEFISGTIQDMTELEKFQIELYQRNKFIETTLENLPIGVAVNLIDSGNATLMNQKFAEIYGWPEEVINDMDTFFKKVYPDDAYRNRIIEMITADIRSEKPDRMNWNGVKITTQTGEEKIINAKNIPLPEQNLMISTVVDVTAQAEAEKRLADSEYNYRLLFQKSPQPMWIYNPENLRFIEVNNAATKHYGYTRKEFHSMTLLDIRPEEDHERLKKEISQGKRTDLSDAKEWRHIKKSGEIINVRITGSSINYFGNQYRLILVNDVTEQKKAEERVLASLVEGENKERARIARELHDGLGQYLAAANMNLDAVRDNIGALSKRKQEQFEKGLHLLKHAVTETGQISRNLLPRVVDDYGLAFAIESLVDNYSSSVDAKITYYHNLKDLTLPREVQFNLYRIAQEGLSNAVKYSEASQINVQLIKDELDLILSIDDNGNGFDPSSDDFIPGLGLRTIETRTGALGGNFEFDSKPNKGTFLSVIIPIHTNSNPS